jgi:hypothetical protein
MSFDLVTPRSAGCLDRGGRHGPPDHRGRPEAPFVSLGAPARAQSCAAPELQTTLAGGIGQRLDAAVEQKTATVEEHVLDTGLLRAFGDRGAHLGGGLHVVLADHAQRAFERRGGGERLAFHVVDQLHADVLVRAMNATDADARLPSP